MLVQNWLPQTLLISEHTYLLTFVGGGINQEPTLYAYNTITRCDYYESPALLSLSYCLLVTLGKLIFRAQ